MVVVETYFSVLDQAEQKIILLLMYETANICIEESSMKKVSVFMISDTANVCVEDFRHSRYLCL